MPVAVTHLGIWLPLPLAQSASGVCRCVNLGVTLLAQPRPLSQGFQTYRYRRRRCRTCGSLLAALDVHQHVAMQILRHSKIAITMEIMVPDQATIAALKRLSDALGPFGAELPDDVE